MPGNYCYQVEFIVELVNIVTFMLNLLSVRRLCDGELMNWKTLLSLFFMGLNFWKKKSIHMVKFHSLVFDSARRK